MLPSPSPVGFVGAPGCVGSTCGPSAGRPSDHAAELGVWGQVWGPEAPLLLPLTRNSGGLVTGLPSPVLGLELAAGPQSVSSTPSMGLGNLGRALG